MKMKKSIYLAIALVALAVMLSVPYACKKGSNALGFLAPNGSLKTTVEQLNLKDRFGNNIFDDITYDSDSNVMLIIDRGEQVDFLGRDEKNTLIQYAQLGLYFVNKYNRNLLPNMMRANPKVFYRIMNGPNTVTEVELIKDDYRACESMHFTDDSITCRRIGLQLDLVPKPFSVNNEHVSYLEEIGAEVLRTAYLGTVVADSGKFGKRAFVKVCDLKMLDSVITDTNLSPEYRDMLTERGLNVVFAEIRNRS